MKPRTFAPLWSSAALALALTLGFAPALRAQDHAAPAHSETAPAAPEAGTGHAAPGQAHEAGAPEGGHEAHGGAKAAHGPVIKLFGVSLGTLAQFGVKVFNFAIFVAILGVLLKGVLASAFQARTKELEDKLSQAERDKAEAEAQIQGLETRMAGLQQELEGIMAKAETDAQGEKLRILESAKAEAAQILAQTVADIEFQKRLAETELRALVAELAIQGATQRLEAQLQGPVAGQVLDRAIDQVGGAK